MSIVTDATHAGIEADLARMHADATMSDAKLMARRDTAGITVLPAGVYPQDLIRLRKEQEEITRREFLEKSKQYVMMAREKENAFWAAQIERFGAMVRRGELAKQTSEDIFKMLEKRCSSFGHLFAGLKEVHSFALNDRSTLRESAISFELLRKSSIEEYEQLKDRVFAVACNNSQILSGDILKRANFLESSGRDLIHEITNQRNKVFDAWVAYEKCATESIKIKQAGKPELIVDKDPVLLGRVYRAELDRLRVINANYSDKMTKLFYDLKLTDGRRVDASKIQLLDYLLAEKQLLQTQLKLTEQAIASVKLIDRERDVGEWVTEGRFIVNDQGKTVFDLIPPNDDKKPLLGLLAREIVMEGVMQRQGRIFASSWTDVHCILTRSGFFHYFDAAADTDPSFSLNLCNVTIGVANPHDLGDNVICFTQPNTSFFSLGNPYVYYMKANSQESLVDWMVALKNYSFIPAAVVNSYAAPLIPHEVTKVAKDIASKQIAAESVKQTAIEVNAESAEVSQEKTLEKTQKNEVVSEIESVAEQSCEKDSK